MSSCLKRNNVTARLMTMSPLYPCGKPCSRGTHHETVKKLALFSSIINGITKESRLRISIPWECFQQGWRQGRARGATAPPSEASSPPPPSEEILGSRRRKFGKITHENTIFQSFQPPCRKLQPLCRKVSGATPGFQFFNRIENSITLHKSCNLIGTEEIAQFGPK